MAKLPTALDLGQRPSPQPSSGIVTYQPNSGAETAVGTTLDRVGQELEGSSDKLYHLAKIEQEKTDTLRAEDAFNQLRDKALDLTLGDKGFVNVRGADAVNKPLFKDYTSQLDQFSKEIGSGLANDDQRIKFQQRSAIGLRQFQENLLKHVTTERQHYEKQVYDGTVSSEINNIGTQFSDPNAFALSVTRMFAAAEQEVQRKGMTSVPGALDVEKQGVLDKAWKARLDAWLNADPAQAYAAFQQNQNQMSPVARLQMKQQIAGHALPVIAAQEAATDAPVVRRLAPQPGAPLPGPTVPSPAVEKYAPVIDANAKQYGVDPGVMRRQLQAESGGNPAARNDGDILKTGSPSLGIAQFQPATAARYGIDPRDPVQSIRGQAAYMSDLLKMFEGDYDKALAGYNWGEGNVQKAVAKYGDGWFAHAPASTQAYVQKIVGVDQRGADFTARNAQYVKPGQNVYNTPLSAPDERSFRSWLAANDVPFDPQAKASDYDMRGFWKALQAGDAKAKSGIDPNDGRLHYPDFWKTPLHETFSNESQWATPDAPRWNDRDQLVDKSGKVIFDDRAPQPQNRTVDYAAMSPAQLLTLKTGNPTIDAMPADDKLRTLGLIHTEALRQRQEKQALLGTREQDARASYYVNGTAANAPTTGDLVDAYGPVEGMKRARGLDEARQTGQTIQQMSTLPTSEIQRVLEQKPAQGEGFAESQRNYELKTAAAQRIVSARQADPVAYALATKSYGIQPMTEDTLKDPQQLTQALRSRAGAAVAMAKDYGTVPAVLTKAEGSAISTVLKQSPVQAQKQYLSAIWGGLGDMNAYKAVLQQVAPDAPTLALAGLYQAKQYQSENPTLGRRDVADLILRGHAILNPPKKEDGGEHIGGKALVKMPKDEEMRLAFNSYVGDAFKDKEKAKDALWQTAKEIYAARTSEEGDDNGGISTDRWKSAMQLASGGIEKHKGASIVLPWGVTYDSLRDQLQQRVTALAPQAVRATAGELANLPLESVGDGRYVFQRGTGYVVDQSGKPLVVDFNVGQAAREAPSAPAIPAAKLNVRDFSVNRSGAVTGRGR